MDNHQSIIMKEKLEFLGIIKEALKLVISNPIVITLTFLTSLPLFCFLFSLEILFQHTFLEIHKLLTQEPYSDGIIFYEIHSPWYHIIDVINISIHHVSLQLFLSGLLFLGIGHLLDLCNTITTVHTASVIYTGQDTVSVKEMLNRPFRKVVLKGPLATSIYVLVLSSLTIMGFVSLSSQLFFARSILEAFFGLAFLALLIKYMEWSAIWNMGIVMSILEDKHGDIALGVSAYISRGRRKVGFLLMLVFFVWKLGLRLMCFCGMWAQRRILFIVTIGGIGLICLGNVVKWVVFTVYFYDCKKRFLEKKVDVEQGRAVEILKM